MEAEEQPLESPKEQEEEGKGEREGEWMDKKRKNEWMRVEATVLRRRIRSEEEKNNGRGNQKKGCKNREENKRRA